MTSTTSSAHATVNTGMYLIKGGTLVNHDRMWKSDLLIDGEKIAKIGTNLAAHVGPDVKVIDATGKFVMPGGIDPHCHMELPFMGTKSADDFAIGTEAAAAGGTTMVIDFILQTNTPLLEAYKIWRKRADPKVTIDYGLHCGVTTWKDSYEAEMKKLVEEEGISSFKFFMAYKGAFQVTDEEFMNGMKACRKLGALAQVHAENGDVIAEGQNKVFNSGVTGPEGHELSRPQAVEEEATNRAILLADTVGCPLYVVHVMSQGACDAIVRGRRRGCRVFGEPIAAGLAVDSSRQFKAPCPVHDHPENNEHHHCADFFEAAAMVMGPPLRPDPTTKTYLMKHLAANLLQVVGTDNCTFTREQKALGKDDFRKMPNGVNGLEDRLRLVWWKGVNEGYLTPSQFVGATSFNAAQIFGIPNKGRLQKGFDADVIIFDPKHEYIISEKHMHHAPGIVNIYEGMKGEGFVTHTFSRGRLLWAPQGDSFKLVSKPGSGKYVKRKNFTVAYDNMDAIWKRQDPAQHRVDRPFNGGQLDVPTQIVHILKNGQKTGESHPFKAPTHGVVPSEREA